MTVWQQRGLLFRRWGKWGLSSTLLFQGQWIVRKSRGKLIQSQIVIVAQISRIPRCWVIFEYPESGTFGVFLLNLVFKSLNHFHHEIYPENYRLHWKFYINTPTQLESTFPVLPLNRESKSNASVVLMFALTQEISGLTENEHHNIENNSVNSIWIFISTCEIERTD